MRWDSRGLVATALPFTYTVNGYRGCSHACRCCFARPTHEYLDFDCGNDFDTQIVVKTNVADSGDQRRFATGPPQPSGQARDIGQPTLF